MTVAGHMARIRALRDLARKRTPDALINEMHLGAKRLESFIGQWRTFPPRASTVIDCENIVEGLRRSLIALRTNQGGSNGN